MVGVIHSPPIRSDIMYIEPNTDIHILKNCPLDSTYQHTLFFSKDDKDAQFRYFYSLKKYSLTNQTYQRVQKGKMRVERKADDLYDCNYLMFRNTAYGDKWFYAFILSVEYVNNITCEITFEIDVMQTWIFDYELRECFVEREHSLTDVVGENILYENVDTGDFIGGDEEVATWDPDSINPIISLPPDKIVLDPPHIVLVIASSFERVEYPAQNTYQYEPVLGKSYAGFFSGLNFHIFENDSAGYEEAISFLKNVGSQADGIFSMFLMPKAFALQPDEYVHNEVAGSDGIHWSGYSFQNPKVISYELPKNLKSVNGYEPRNKKLLTGQFNFLRITNQQGEEVEYHFEDFQDNVCSFMVEGDMSANPSIMLTPTHYKGAQYCYGESISITNLPQLAFTTDTFKAWYAQNQNSLITAPMMSLFSSIVGGGVQGGVMGALNGFVTKGAPAVANTVAGVLDRKKMPNITRGTNTQNLLAFYKRFGFMYQYRYIKESFAKIIDDYFDMFGYATHRLKKPNIGTRPHWNYVKTIDCVVVGSVPSDDMKKICSVYDKGVTFWKNGNDVGKYSELDNTV